MMIEENVKEIPILLYVSRRYSNSRKNALKKRRLFIVQARKKGKRMSLSALEVCHITGSQGSP